MKQLAISLCTRGRPDLLDRTISITVQNMVRPNTVMYVMVDDDDDATREYLSSPTFDAHWNSGHVVPFVAMRPYGFGAKFNRVLDLCRADLYLTMVDYAPHITPGFDQMLLDASEFFVDGIGVVYNDIIERLPAINAVTRRFAELNDNTIYAPWFPFGAVDLWLDDIAQATGRIAYCPVTIDRSLRPGSQNKRDPQFWNSFYNIMTPIRVRLVKNILAECIMYEHERALLLNNITMRMQWVFNHNAKSNLNILFTDPLFKRPIQYDKLQEPDEMFHQRAKEAAIAAIEDYVSKGWISRVAAAPALHGHNASVYGPDYKA